MDFDRLARLAHLEASDGVLETLTKDQFVEALPDEELRLRVAQSRPHSLRTALGVSLQIEAFSLAGRRRATHVRMVQGSRR